MFIELHQSTQILKSDLNGYFINCFIKRHNASRAINFFNTLPGALGGFLGGAVGVVPRR